jgi:protease-4
MPNAGTDFFLQYLNKIAVIEIDGEIVTGNNGENILFGGRVVGADTIVDQIKRATDDPSIKAILLRVNSPGGSSIASAQIYTELMKARKKNKVVVASMGEIAASGGYMVSSAAEKIIADPSTLTGAIGVITGDGIPVFKGLYGKLGVKVDTIKEGKHADMFAGTRKMTTDEVQSMKDIFKESYDDFVSKVAIGREFPTKEVYSMAEGRVYTGQQAKDLGLVDKLGGFVDAIQETKSLAGIRGDARLIYYENYRGFWYESSVNALLKQPGVIELIGQSWRQILGSQSDN